MSPPISATRPPRVYIAGPYRADSLSGISRNISNAARLQAPIAGLGCYPVCVHKNEGLELHDVQQANRGQFWVDATLGELETCHAVVLAPNWENSVGTAGEMWRALELGLPIFEGWISSMPEEWNRLLFPDVATLCDYRVDRSETFLDWAIANVVSRGAK